MVRSPKNAVASTAAYAAVLVAFGGAGSSAYRIQSDAVAKEEVRQRISDGLGSMLVLLLTEIGKSTILYDYDGFDNECR